MKLFESFRQRLAEGRRNKHPARPYAQKTSFVVRRGPQAACFDVAFHRFVELKGRTLVDPRDRCSITSRPEKRSEIKIVGLWSRKAMAQFREFWPRYARVYGVVTQHNVFAAHGVRVA